MLIIASDIHLADGTCAKSITPSAFYLFQDRLREAAYHASWRTDNTYRPIEQIDIVLAGDILDPIHSTLWLKTLDSQHPDYIRPWSDPSLPVYAPMLRQVTRAMLEKNNESLDVLRNIAKGISLPPADSKGRPAYDTEERTIVPVRIHYMIGNHDWYYHLKGPAFDEIRADIIKAMGLSNPVDNFPWEAEEYPLLDEIFKRYKVYARHGDRFDKFNYNPIKGRDAGTLGDAFALEVLNRFPIEITREFGDTVPGELVESLKKLVNVRPALATPLWVTGQIRQYAGSLALEKELKKVWDKVCDEFLQVDFVRDSDVPYIFDTVDALEAVIKISNRTSFDAMAGLATWVHERMSDNKLSFVKYALEEPKFVNNSARYIVYGHTHYAEIIPLDAEGAAPYPESQVYFNSGTWHSYYALAVKNPKEQKFVPYQSMNYVTFYRGDERGGRHYEFWSGAFS